MVKILAASYEGADQIHANPAALQKMGEISAKLYKEQNADYWVRYYKGTVELDAQGVRVPLGGSYVSNLADGLQSFGMNGGPNLLSSTYNTFGKIVVQQYPKMYPDFPPISKVLDTSFVKDVRAMNQLPTDNAETVVTTNSSAPMKSIEGRRDYAIQFGSGSAQILSSSFGVLNQLADEIMVTTYITGLHGYTDSAKWVNMNSEQSTDRNLQLSNERCNAVKDYLVKRGVKNVIRSYGHGEESPIAPNTTEVGRSKNRRVQVVLGL
jgi:OmpA-OmpF porin, OOP family